jgi:cytochrome c-type biogenesis protein CcmH
MRPWLGWIAIAWMLAICAVIFLAYGHTTSRPTLDQRTRALATHLRCPICHGESVADSTTDIARSIRSLIRQRLSTGESPDAIEQYLTSRYGNSIVLAPPTSGIGSIAWFAPLLLLLGGLGLLVTLVADWRSRSTAPAVESVQYLQRVRAEVAEAQSRLPGRAEVQ